MHTHSTPETRPVTDLPWKTLLVAGFAGAILWTIGALLAFAIFAPGAFAAKPRPLPAPPPPVRASTIEAYGGRVQPCATVPCLRRAIRWHRKYERHLLSVKFPVRDAYYAIRLASAAFHIPAADMRTIAQCESRMGAQVTAEAGSGASGLFQFLPSTWAHTPYAGFDIFDPFANALAAAQLVAHDHGWHQWSCSSITGVR